MNLLQEDLLQDSSVEEKQLEGKELDEAVHDSLLRNREFWNNHFGTSLGEIGSSLNADKQLQNYDWLIDYDELCEAGVLSLLQPHHVIAVLGCGSSALGPRLFEAGFKNVVNMDISEVVIEQMRQKHEETHPGMKWVVGDVTNMTCFEDGMFDIVLDKATADTLQFRCKSGVRQELLERMFSEVRRILKTEGVFLLISPRKHVPILEEGNWSVVKQNLRLSKGYVQSDSRRPRQRLYSYTCTNDKAAREAKAAEAIRVIREEAMQRAATSAPASHSLCEFRSAFAALPDVPAPDPGRGMVDDSTIIRVVLDGYITKSLNYRKSLSFYTLSAKPLPPSTSAPEAECIESKESIPSASPSIPTASVDTAGAAEVKQSPSQHQDDQPSGQQVEPKKKAPKVRRPPVAGPIPPNKLVQQAHPDGKGSYEQPRGKNRAEQSRQRRRKKQGKLKDLYSADDSSDSSDVPILAQFSNFDWHAKQMAEDTEANPGSSFELLKVLRPGDRIRVCGFVARANRGQLTLFAYRVFLLGDSDATRD